MLLKAPLISGSSFARVDSFAGTGRIRALLGGAIHVRAAALFGCRARTRQDRGPGRPALLGALHSRPWSRALEARERRVRPLLPFLGLVAAFDETALAVLWNESLSAHIGESAVRSLARKEKRGWSAVRARHERASGFVSKRSDQRSECRRRLPAARVIEMVAGEGGEPLFQNPGHPPGPPTPATSFS